MRTKISRQEKRQKALQPPEQNLHMARHAAKGGLIALAAQAARLLMQIGGTAALSRLLIPGDFGVLAMAATVTGFVAMFSDMGLSTATIQRSDISQETVSTLFFINLIVGLILTIIAAIFAPLASIFYHDVRIQYVILALALTIPISAAGSQHAALLARRLRWGPLQLIGVLSDASGLICAIILAWKFNAGYLALIAQPLVSALISMTLNTASSGWLPSFHCNISNAQKEIGFGLYLTAFSFLNYFHRQFDNVLIGHRYGPVPLGYYSRAYNLMLIPINLVNSSVSQVAIPALSRLSVDRSQWLRAFFVLISVSSFLAIGTCTILYLSAAPLIHLLLGTQWTSVIPIFRALMVASIFSTATNGCGWAFISTGKSKPYFHWSLFASPLFVLSFVVGLPWGPLGVAKAYSVAMFLLAPTYLAYTARVIGFEFSRAMVMIAPPVLLAPLTVLVAQAFQVYAPTSQPLFALLVTAAIGAVMYGLSAIILIALLPQYRYLRGMVRQLTRNGRLEIRNAEFL